MELISMLWNGAITYGDTAKLIAVSLLCLVLIVLALTWIVLTTLQRKRK